MPRLVPPCGTMTDIATDSAVPPARSGGRKCSADPAAATNWQRTLWAMVGIQFIMTMSFSFLTPIMPLFLPILGVHSEAAIDMWAGILSGSTSFVAAFASPLWGRLADQHGRKLMLLRSSCAIAVFTALDGAVAGRLAVLRGAGADGRVRRLLLDRDGAGGEPGAGGAARLFARPAVHRPTCRIAGWAGDRRGARRPYPQLSHSILLHLGGCFVALGLVWRGRAGAIRHAGNGEPQRLDLEEHDFAGQRGGRFCRCSSSC